MATPLLDPDASQKELQAIHNEWSTQREDDSRNIQRILGLTGNAEHPISRLQVGNKDVLRNKDDVKLHDELHNFYNNFYSANRMVLVLAGKESTQQLKALAKKHFSQVKNNQTPKSEITVPGLTKSNLLKKIEYKPNVAGRSLMLEFPISFSNDIESYKPLAYISELISANDKGTLVDQLQKQDLINNVIVTTLPKLYGNNGIYRIAFDITEKGIQQQDKIIASTFRYLKLIQEKGITQEHFSSLQSRMKKAFDEQPQSDLLSLSNYLAEAMTLQPFETLLTSPYTIKSFNRNAITQVLEQLKPSNSRMWVLAPDVVTDTPVEDYAGHYKVTQITPSQLKTWESLQKEWQFILPKPVVLSEKNQATLDKKLTKPTKIVDTTSAQAWLMHSQHFDQEKGIFYLIINNPLWEKNIHDFILSGLLKDLLIEENKSLLQQYSRRGINSAVERTPYSAHFIQLTGDTDSQPELLQKLMTSLATSTFSERQFKRAKANFKDWVSNWDKAQPVPQMFGLLREHMELPSRNSELVLPEIDKVSLDELHRYRQGILRDSTLLVFAFGHYNPDTIETMIKNAEKPMGVRSPKVIVNKQYIKPEPNTAFLIHRASDQGDNALLDVYLRPENDIQQFANLLLINTMFNNAIFSNLRTKEQLAYEVGSTPLRTTDYTGVGIFIRSENKNLPELKQRIDDFRQQFALFLPKLDNAILEQIKQSLLVQIEQKPQNMAAEGDSYLNDFLDGNYQFDGKENLVASIRSATKEDINATYQSFLLEGSMKLLIQQKGKKFIKSSYASPDRYQKISSSNEFHKLMSGASH